MLFLLAACDLFVLCDVVYAPHMTDVVFTGTAALREEGAPTISFELPSGRRISCPYSPEGAFCDDQDGHLGWEDGMLVATFRDVAPEVLWVEFVQDGELQGTWEVVPDYTEAHPDGDRCPPQLIGEATVDLGGG